MTEPPREASGSLEVLETSDEGKKKSKFKILRSFFTKKKKKGPEEVQGMEELRPDLSSSDTNTAAPNQPLPEVQQTEPRVRRVLKIRALSHDSIFMMEPEPERSATEVHSPPEPSRGRTTQRSYDVSRTLPRSGPVGMQRELSGVVFGPVPQFMPRSGMWVAGSKITEAPPLRPRQPSISPPCIRSDTIAQGVEDIIVDESRKTLPKKASQKKVLTLKKSSSEPASRPLSFGTTGMLASPSRILLPSGFSTPGNTQGFFSPPAATKRSFNSRKQKKTKAAMKAKQEGLSLLASQEGKSTTISKEIEQRKLNKDSSGSSNQELSDKAEICHEKTTVRATNIDAAGGQGYPSSVPCRRKRGRKGSSPTERSENEFRRRNVKLRNRRVGLGDIAGSLLADKTASSYLFWPQSVEKMNMEQLTAPQAETTASQEWPLDQDAVGMRNAGSDIETGKASASQLISEDKAQALIGGPQLRHEDEASPTKETGRASLLPAVESLSPTLEDIFSMVVETQEFPGPSHFQAEDMFSFDSQSLQLEMESAGDTLTTCKEKPPAHALQALPASVSGIPGAAAEGGTAIERLPQRSLSQSVGSFEVEHSVTVSESASEMGNDSDQPFTSECSFQSLEMLENEQELYPELQSLAVETSPPEQQQQLAPKYSSQSTGTHQAISIRNSESDSAGTDFDQQLALGKPKDNPEALTESDCSVNQWRNSDVLALGKAKDKVSTKSSSCVARYSSTEDWSSSEGELPLTLPPRALGKPKHQREVSSVLKNVSEESSVPMQPVLPKRSSEPFVGLNVQQQVSSSSVSVPKNSAPVPPPRQLFQPWLDRKVEQETSVKQERDAVDWGVCIEPLPPRIISRRLIRPQVDCKVSSESKGSRVAAPRGITPVELLGSKYSSQPPMKPVTKQKISAGPASTAIGGNVSSEMLFPRYPSQPLVRPVIGQQVLQADCSVVSSLSTRPLLPRHPFPPLMKSLFQQQGSVGPEYAGAGAGAGRGSSMAPLPLRHPFQQWVMPTFRQKAPFPESTAVKGSIPMESLPPKVSAQSLKTRIGQNVFSGLEGAAAGRVILTEQLLPQSVPQTLPTQAQHVFSGDTATGFGRFVGLLPPTYSLQPMVRPNFPPQIMTPSSAKASAEWCSPVEPMPPKDIFQPWVTPQFDSQVSAERAAIEWGIPLEPLPPRMPSQRSVRSLPEHKIASSVNAPAELDTAAEPAPPKDTFRPWVNPKFEPPASAGAEGAKTERNISVAQLIAGVPFQHPMKPAVKQPTSTGSQGVAVERGVAADIPGRMPLKHSWSSMRHKMYQVSSNFQPAAGAQGVSGVSVPLKHSPQLLMKSKMQPVSSCLENTVAEGGALKQFLVPRPPSQSFVKFMAQQFFSESQTVEGGMYVDPSAPTQPPRSAQRPKVQPQALSGWESAAAVQQGISLKQLPMQPPSQSARKPENLHQAFSQSESTPVKWGSSKDQLPPQQRFQVEEGTKIQSQIFSTGLAKASIGWSPIPFANLGYRQPNYSSSMSATPEGTILGRNPSSFSQPKSPAAPNKTKKHSSEDLTKSIPTPNTKTRKFTTSPKLQTSTAEGMLSKKEVLERKDQSNNHPNLTPSGITTQNIFGVRLKKTPSSQKYKREKRDDLTQLSSVSSDLTSSSIGRGQKVRKSTSQSFPVITENLITTPEFVEKQQNRPSFGRMTQKQPAYKIPGKSDRKSPHATSEPSWIAMLKLKQRSLLAHVPMSEPKSKSTFGDIAETEEHKYEDKMAEVKLPVSTRADENTKVSTKADVNTLVSTRADENTHVSTKADENTHVSTKADENTHVSTKADENIHVSIKADENIHVSTKADENTHVFAKADENTHVSTKAAEEALVSPKAGETTQVSTVADENTQVSTVADENTQVSTVADENTLVSTTAGENFVSTKAGENTCVSPKEVPVGLEDETTFQGPAMTKETEQSSTCSSLPQEEDEPVWFSMAKKKAKAWSQIAETMQ